ncbi:MAG: glycosyltransferase family 2 protein [Nitrososphaerota archaeon]|nr:glycosyltransferase family 2 protein [Nitrososphaerota archaeon]
MTPKYDLTDVTVSIFTKSLTSKNTTNCLRRLPSGVLVLLFEGSLLHRFVIERNKAVQLGEVEDLQLTGFNFSRNCNLTAKFVETDWTLLLNDDCFVTEGCVEETLRIAQKTSADIVGAKLFDPLGRLRNRGLIIDKRYRHGFAFDERDSNEEYSETDGVSGAYILVRTELLRKIPFDDNYLMGYEDIDFSMRAKRLGSKLVIANRATATHLMSSSSAPFSIQIKKARSASYFFAKYPSFKSYSREFFELVYGPTWSVRRMLSRSHKFVGTLKKLGLNVHEN